VFLGISGPRKDIGTITAVITKPDITMFLKLKIALTSVEYHSKILSSDQFINMNNAGVKLSSILENQIVEIAIKPGRSPIITCGITNLLNSSILKRKNKSIVMITVEKRVQNI
jgi:hypothetical protein